MRTAGSQREMGQMLMNSSTLKALQVLELHKLSKTDENNYCIYVTVSKSGALEALGSREGQVRDRIFHFSAPAEFVLFGLK